MSWVTEAFGEWYPIVYPHRDENEARALVETLGVVVSLSGERLLDVGCGPGRHLVRFRRAGARPFGIDLSPELLRQARAFRDETGGDWPLVRGDMRRLPWRSGAFGGALSLFTSFGYFEEEEDRRTLGEAARVVRPGGFHVLDFLNREKVLAHPKPEGERSSGGYRILERRRVVGGDRRIVKRVVIESEGGETVADYEERVNLYGPDELRGLLESAGLRPAHEWGEYDGSPFDAGTSSRHVFVSFREKE